MSHTAIDIPVWLINLPRATDRREKMERQLEESGLAYTLFPGIDGKAEQSRLLKTVNIPEFERNMGREILIGGIGCYHSHLAVWREFISSGASIALILEDDVVFHSDFLNAVEMAAKASDYWDLLKLNRIRAKIPVKQGSIGSYSLNAYLGPNTGTGAYLIKRETAIKLLSAMLPITRATDHEINRFFVHKFRLRGLEPFPSHVDDGSVSLITGMNFSEVRKFPFWRRWPHYRLKVANYIWRLVWLIRTGEIIPKSRIL